MLPHPGRMREPGLVSPYKVFDHQKKCIHRMIEMERRRDAVSGVHGGILYADMGLGKTLVAMLLCKVSPSCIASSNVPVTKIPTLVIVNLGLMMNWKSEHDKFFGCKSSLSAFCLHKDVTKCNPDEFQLMRQSDLIITTYDVILGCHKYMEKRRIIENTTIDEKQIQHIIQSTSSGTSPGTSGISHRRRKQKKRSFNDFACDILWNTEWPRIICDESQRFANPNNSLFQSMCLLKGKCKWCLTGTPIRNSQVDVWSQLTFCGLKGVDVSSFDVDKYHEQHLNRHIIQMTYEEANITLPLKIYRYMNLMPTPTELHYYAAQAKCMNNIFSDVDYGDKKFSDVLSMLTRMRQSANSPHLSSTVGKIDNSKRASELSNDTQEAVLRNMSSDMKCKMSSIRDWLINRFGSGGIGSTKLRFCANLIQMIAGFRKEKIVVFSCFKESMFALQQALIYFKVAPCGEFSWVQLDGGLSISEREKKKKTFLENESCRVMIIHYKVGCEGLTLVNARHMLFLDPWWSPAVQLQAEARIHRIGQTHSVCIWIPVLKCTVESKVHSQMRSKLQIAAAMLGGSLKEAYDKSTHTNGELLEDKSMLGLEFIRNIMTVIDEEYKSSKETKLKCCFCGALCEESDENEYEVPIKHPTNQNIAHRLCITMFNKYYNRIRQINT